MKMVRLFIYSAAVVLLFTAVAIVPCPKLLMNFLQTRDPLFGFQFGDLFRIIGGIEVVVALVCIFSKRTWLPAGLVAWLATAFAAYRLGLSLVGYHSLLAVAKLCRFIQCIHPGR
jgi:hypothetical protein